MTENKDKRAVQELVSKIVRQEREMVDCLARCERKDRLLAIQAEQIRLANERGDYWRGECVRLMRGDCGLTAEKTSLKVGGTRDEGGINFTHKEDI